jgi:hypothetical protein
VLEIMKQEGFAAVTLGVEDLELGADLLRSLAEDDAAPFVSANLWDPEAHGLLLPESRIVERAGLRIGITAATVPAESEREDVEASGLEFRDPDDALEDVVRRLRDETDFVIVLARMPLAEAQRIGEELYGMIDLVVTGGGIQGRGRVFPEHGGALYMVAGNRGQALGVTRVALGGPDGKEVEAIVGDELVLSREYPEDPETAALVKSFESTLNELLKQHAVESAVHRAAPDGHYYVGVENCAKCHEREYRLWLETPHSDAFRTLVNAGTDALPECFRCHVTGSGDPAGYVPEVRGSERLRNVQCEVCHGKGTAHARDGSYGASLLMNVCRRCHDEENSPDFDPEVYWLMIEH